MYMPLLQAKSQIYLKQIQFILAERFHDSYLDLISVYTLNKAQLSFVLSSIFLYYAKF